MIAASSEPPARAEDARSPVSAPNSPMSSGHTTRFLPDGRRWEAKSSAPRWVSGLSAPRSRRSASANILSWEVSRLPIQARSSFGCMAKTRVVVALAPAPGGAASSRRSAALSQRVDARRKLEVVLREPALGGCREGERDRVPGERYVGVVVHLLRGRRDAVDEVDRSLEVVELELTRDRV